MLEFHPAILPWSNKSIADLLNKFRDPIATADINATPQKPRTWLKTAFYLTNICGLTPLIQTNQLIRKRDAVRAHLITDCRVDDKRALAPTKRIIKFLEMATTLGNTYMDRWFASACRHIAGASGRFNDYMHTADVTLKETPHTVELAAWQTKVTDLMDRKRPIPLIATKDSISGKPWWEVFVAGLLHLQKILGPHDYIFPAPTRDRNGVRPEPLRSGTALKWYRDILVMGGLPIEEAKRQSLAGLRVFMPELAYQTGIPRDRRRYLGRWLAENMADTYTREHRTVIGGIWKQALEFDKDLPDNDMAPTELTAKHYDLDPDDTDYRKPLAEGTGPASAASSPPPEESALPNWPGGVPYTVEPIPLQDEISEGWSLEKDGSLTTPPGFDGDLEDKEEQTPRRTPADLVTKKQGGPLKIIVNEHTYRMMRKAHLLRPTLVTVCGYRPKPGKTFPCDDVADWIKEVVAVEPCKTCFRFFTVPTDWEVPVAMELWDAVSNVLGPIPIENLPVMADSSESSSGQDTSEAESDTDADDGALPITTT
jgi:hypothetical protein